MRIPTSIRTAPDPPSALAQSAAIGPRGVASRTLAAAAEKPATALFCGYLLLLLIEYSGIQRNLIPVLQVLRLSTVLAYVLLLGVLARLGTNDVLRHRQTKLLLFFVFFTAASVMWAVVQTYAFQTIRPFVDQTVLFFLTFSLVDRRRRVDALSWTFVVVSVYVVIRNFEKLGAATRTGYFVGGSFMGDGNDFAWALNVMLPLILNLVLGERSWFTRLGGLLGVACCLVGIVGTSSRGATLGIAAMALYYLVVVTRRKLVAAAVLLAVGAAVLVVASPEYVTRMQGIADYQTDNSSVARLQMWATSIKMAVDHPLGVGGGNFANAYGRDYIPEGEANAINWGSARWLSAHSIYFKTLGEYGFVGLAVLLWLIITNFRDSRAARAAFAAHPDEAPVSPVWPALVSMAMVGHAVCGVFLASISYPHLFLLSGLALANKRLSLPFTAPPKALRGGVDSSAAKDAPPVWRG